MSIDLEPDPRVKSRHLSAAVQRRDDKIARHITIFRQFVIADDANDPIAMRQAIARMRDEGVGE